MSEVITEDIEEILKRDIDWKKFNNKTILISGAYGMLASYLVYLFLSLDKICINVKLVVIVRKKEKFIELFGNNSNVDILETNMVDKINYSKEIDYIIHAASIANPAKYSTNPVEVIQPNTIGTYYLLELAREKNVKSFLLFSSGDIYGQVDNPNHILESTVGKVDPLGDRSCYAESKRMAETFCRAYFCEYNVPTKIARIGHTYGPTMDINNDPRVFSSMIKCVVEERDIVMNSDGSAKRPFCYIADATAAYIQILLEGKSGEAYNVCNTEEFISIKEFAECVLIASNNRKIRIVNNVRDKADKYLVDKINIDNKPLEYKLRELGWKTKYNTIDGLSRTINHIREIRNEKN